MGDRRLKRGELSKCDSKLLCAVFPPSWLLWSQWIAPLNSPFKLSGPLGKSQPPSPRPCQPPPPPLVNFIFDLSPAPCFIPTSPFFSAEVEAAAPVSGAAVTSEPHTVIHSSSHPRFGVKFCYIIRHCISYIWGQIWFSSQKEAKMGYLGLWQSWDHLLVSWKKMVSDSL